MSKTVVGFILFAIGLATCSPLGDLSVFGYDPEANPAAVITEGNARFTVLTPWVIRMEYSSDAVFEDRATIVAVNRKLPVPAFNISKTSRTLTVSTSAVELKYFLGSPFSRSSLMATTSTGAVWHFGDNDDENLFGTIRSLDYICSTTLNCSKISNVTVYGESLHCAWGVVSRKGWTVVDDTKNYIMEATAGKWFSADDRSKDDIDVYFFGHGKLYRQALFDFTQVAGKAPMTHKALLGSWWTRWYDFDEFSIKRLVEIFTALEIPLDVLVLDMNWHTKQQWTGYSWDRQLFPYPNDTLESLRHRGLFTSANLHDAEGVASYEDKYVELCDIMGQDPGAKLPVPFQPLNETFMHALDDIVVNSAGFDFYWIDWQQGGSKGGCTGGRLNPTIITDHVRGTTHARRNENMRDQTLARFGGLGSHRYPVGFSGDVGLGPLGLSWECYAFEPYFSATAANTGYGMISHDLVGPPFDHELHVRWMQFGSFSAVLRIHDRGLSAGVCEWFDWCGVVNIWRLPFRYFTAIRDIMQKRISFLPYFYTESRVAFDTGVALLHPMYYDFPEYEESFIMKPDGVHAQYMLGSSVLAAPICSKANATTGMASKEVWVPPGDWFDDIFGIIVSTEDGTLTRHEYAMEEFPLFVRAGEIIPRLANPSQIGVASTDWRMIDVHVYPSPSPVGTTVSYKMYEDDGSTLEYLKGNFSFTEMSYSKVAPNALNFTISANRANPFVSKRSWQVFLVSSYPPQEATVNGVAAKYSKFPKEGVPSWRYDGQTCTVIFSLGDYSPNTNIELRVRFVATQNSTAFDRVRLYASRMQIAKRLLDDVRETPYSNSYGPGHFKIAASYGAALEHMASENPSAFVQHLDDYTSVMKEALAEISEKGGARLDMAQALLRTALPR